MASHEDHSGDTDRATHIDHDDMDKFFSGELHPEKNRQIEEHVATCDECLQGLADQARHHLALSPITDEEKKLIASLPGLTTSEHVKQFLSRLPKTERAPSSFISEVFEEVRDFFSKLDRLPLPMPAVVTVAIAIVFVITFGSYRLYEYREVNRLVATGYDSLRVEWTLTGSDFRPIGGFDRSIFSRPHGEAPNIETAPAVVAFKAALERDRNNQQALLGLSTVNYLSGHLQRADSLVQIILSEDSTNAAAWNNLGLIRKRRNEIEQALAAFEAALKYEPKLVEARFNRALLLSQQNQRERAQQAWLDYLKIDSDSKWADTARQWLETLDQP